MEIEEDTYSNIFQALKHPIRRRILKMLKQQPMTYTEILNELGIDNGLLNYHLENLRELMAKGDYEKYRLSEFGRAGLSVIDRVETPKDSYVKPSYLKIDSLPSILIIILLFSSALLNGYYYIDNKNLRSENLQLSLDQNDSVSGIIIHQDENRLWLRLTSPDHVNNREVGDIVEYLIHINGTNINAGDYLKGKLVGNMTLVQESRIPFFQYDYNYGFVISGDLLLFGGGITHDLTDPYPTLRFSIKNLGEKEIIAIRARINELDLPYTFGLSNDNPLRPLRSESFSHYSAWYTPGGGVGGYFPMDGEEYTVTVTVKFSDYSTQTFTRSDVFRESNFGSIRFRVGRNYLFFNEPDLLWLGLGEGGSLNLCFRNEWYKGSSQIVEYLELYLEDILVWEEDVRVSPSKYFAITVHVPFELVPGQNYNVTLVAHSVEGLNSIYSRSTLCQYIRIK